MLCNKIIGSSKVEKSIPEEWEYFRSLANENESAFLVASGGIDTIAFSGAAAFNMRIYGGVDGTQLLYIIGSDSNKKIDIWSRDTDNHPLPTGLLFSRLQGKPYYDEIVGEVELFTVVTSGSNGNPVGVAVAETGHSALGLPSYRVLACDLNIPSSPTIKGCVKNAGELRKVFFKAGMTAIPPHAFYNSGLEECEIPDTITYLNSAVFYGTPIEKISIPDTVTVLGEYLFSQCSRLKEVKLPTGATSISSGMFNGCAALNKIHIPSTYKKVLDTAFNGCRSLKNIELPDTLSDFGPNSIFSNCDILDSFELNATFTRIGNGTDMFANCHQLRFINIPHIKLGSFGCQGKSSSVKNKIGYAERGDRDPIVLDWANFATTSTLSTIWNTSYTCLTEADYLNMFNKFYENGKVFTDKNFVITGSDGATDAVRDFITDKLGAVCVG